MHAVNTIQLTRNLSIYQGHINVGVIRDGDRCLLIDFGDGSILDALDGMTIDTILFTHHHRDQACGINSDLRARIVVPEAEKPWFDDVASYWNDPKHRWHLYCFHPHRLMLAESIRVDGTVADGDVIEWGPARITALGTPGHTDGSMSYIVDIDGERLAFTGDLIHSPGRIWELYSMQKGGLTTDYHGFLGSRGELAVSLRAVLAHTPSALIPSHGGVMRDPKAAVDMLIERIQRCMDSYVEISALRHYFPQLWTDYAVKGKWMPFAPASPLPDFMRHSCTTFALISESGAAFVMDCCSATEIEAIKSWMADGAFERIEGLWVTHYHDDHVDGIPAFQREFDCELIAHESVAEIISNPLAWRLPCISPHVARVDRIVKDSETWQWHEFTMTAYHFPGQTLHHGGLLVEGRGMRLFFIGDSFIMSGIDDYCPPNRLFMGEGVGFDRCLKLVRELKPDLMFNPHCGVGFRFTDDEIDYMLANWTERAWLYGELFPWDDPNFGMDESWVYCHPYEQHVSPGCNVEIEVVVTNHSHERREASAKAASPVFRELVPETNPYRAIIPPKQVARLPIRLSIPSDTAPGRCVVPIDVSFGGVSLPRMTEAVVVVGA